MNSVLKFFKIVSVIIFCIASQISCQTEKIESNRTKDFPPKILWAWERPENLEFIDVKQYGVAFLAQTLILQNDEVLLRPRRQPLKVPENAFVIAVTRIESAASNSANRAKLSDNQRQELISLILKTLTLKNVRAVQIDFDATVSERAFYRNLLNDLRSKLPESMPLSMTALASFCVGDKWISDLPVDEAIPMIFDMGADDKIIKNYLITNDFKEPLCQKSYGIANDEPLTDAKLDASRRLYIFNVRPWTEKDLQNLTAK
ncbi:MAG: hypothetical protein H7Z37_10850 [Pyrinomonadaceae bacterium]|nr:hypothetical protein [Pyrinomonadaceae bacterium]